MLKRRIALSALRASRKPDVPDAVALESYDPCVERLPQVARSILLSEEGDVATKGVDQVLN
jgi:hypothetical protein